MWRSQLMQSRRAGSCAHGVERTAGTRQCGDPAGRGHASAIPGARVWDLDLSSDPPPDEQFDLVVTVLTLHHIPSRTCRFGTGARSCATTAPTRCSSPLRASTGVRDPRGCRVPIPLVDGKAEEARRIQYPQGKSRGASGQEATEQGPQGGEARQGLTATKLPADLVKSGLAPWCGGPSPSAHLVVFPPEAVAATHLLEDVDGPRDHQQADDERDGFLGRHQELAPRPDRGDVSWAERGGRRERQVQVVDELRIPVGVDVSPIVRSGTTQAQPISVDPSSVECRTMRPRWASSTDGSRSARPARPELGSR